MQSRGLRGALVAGAMALMVLCAPFAHADEVSPAADAEITVTDDGIELIPATSQEEALATTVTDDEIELIPATSSTEAAPTESGTAASAESAASSVGSAVSLATSAAPTTAVATTSSPAAGAPASSDASSDDGGIEVLGVSSEIAAGASGHSSDSNVGTIIWIAAGILVAVGAGALLFRFRNAAGR